jgi:hypothetical protein
MGFSFFKVSKAPTREELEAKAQALNEKYAMQLKCVCFHHGEIKVFEYFKVMDKDIHIFYTVADNTRTGTIRHEDIDIFDMKYQGGLDSIRTSRVEFFRLKADLRDFGFDIIKREQA